MISLWFTKNVQVPIWSFPRIIYIFMIHYGSVGITVFCDYDTKIEWVRYPDELTAISIVNENFF